MFLVIDARKHEDKSVTEAGDYSIGTRAMPESGMNTMWVEACFNETGPNERLRVRTFLKRAVNGQGNLLDWSISEVEVHKVSHVGTYCQRN